MHAAEPCEPASPLRAGFAHTMIGQQGDEALLKLQPRKSGDEIVLREPPEALIRLAGAAGSVNLWFSLRSITAARSKDWFTS